MNNIGKRIKELRKKNDLTQERLAEYLGVTDKAVSKWECGLTAPDLGLIIPLSRILHVSADELLGGKPEENDAKRIEYNERCDNYLKYDAKESYEIAQKAVSEYPNDYKYLYFLALTEMYMSYRSECVGYDPTVKYSREMLERAIKHCNIVIEECEDSTIKGNAIWNAMVCYRDMGRYDEARKYAEMFPERQPLTRDSAIEMCLQGEELISHRKMSVYKKLSALCVSLSRIYCLQENSGDCEIAALDAEEAILKAVLPDGNYLDLHKNLCCAYQKRATLAIKEGDHDKAVEHLQTMLEHAAKIPEGKVSFTSGVLEGLSVYASGDNMLPYTLHGLDDISKPIIDQLKNRLNLEVFAPLRDREDFKAMAE